MAATRADGWSSDGTAHALAWINLGENTGRTRGGEMRDLDMVINRCPRIAREISESAYSWHIEWDRKRELAGIGDKVD